MASDLQWHLLLADTDETQAYVFESSRLPEIRGASRQIHDGNQELVGIVAQAGGRTIYAGGGGLLALVPSPQAQSVVDALEAYLPHKTGAATLTAVARSLPPDAAADQFGQVTNWLAHILRRRKESKAAPPFWETLPHQVRCASCQKRPALAGLAGEWCEVCWQKRNYQARFAWFKQFELFLGSRSHNYYANRQDRTDHPQDMNELGQACHSRNGYVAFIYLDGDRIGQLLQAIPTEALYRDFSHTMQQVTETAVFKALADHLQLTQVTGSPAREEVGEKHLVGKPIWIHPFEIITIGGDDVMLIVPAETALPIATAIGQAFGQQMTQFVREKLGRKEETVSMSGGVVIADDHTPVRLLRELASQLQDEAKKLPNGGLDFLVLKSADMLADSVEGVRSQYPYLLVGGDRRTGKDLRLVARPYSYPEAVTIWESLGKLRQANFANSQLHLLARSLLDGRSPATLFYEYQRSRNSRDRRAYAQLQVLFTSLYGEDEHDPLPWQAVSEADYSYRTALWDIAELYDFVA